MYTTITDAKTEFENSGWLDFDGIDADRVIRIMWDHDLDPTAAVARWVEETGLDVLDFFPDPEIRLAAGIGA